MQDIMLDKDFQFLLPPLDEEAYRGLEQNLLEFGTLFPLVLWNGILIDGTPRAASPTTEMQKLGVIVNDFAKNYNKMLKGHDSNKPKELMKVLRLYIDQLEELYRRMDAI